MMAFRLNSVSKSIDKRLTQRVRVCTNRRPQKILILCLTAAAKITTSYAAVPDLCQSSSACRERVTAATQLASQGHFDDALPIYEKAYEQSQEPRLLLNIGRCHHRLNHPQKALDYYEKFRAAQPDLEPEVASRLAQFVAEAKLALLSSILDGTADKNGSTTAEPPPAPLRTDATDGNTKPSMEPSRPKWRLALGLSAAGAGGVLLGFGIAALAANDSCVHPSPTFPGQCATEIGPDGQRRALLVDGLTPGIPLVVSGGLLVVGGIMLAAWPARAERSRPSQRTGSSPLAEAK